MLQNFFKKLQISDGVVYLLYLTAFLLPFALEITTGLIYLTSGLALYECIKRKKIFSKLCSHNYFFIAWVIIAGLSVVKSLNIAASFYNYQVLISQYASLYFLGFFYIDNKDKLKKILLCFTAATLLVSSYGILQYIQGISLMERLEWVDVKQFPELKTRVFSTLSNPNILAAYLCMSICLSIGLILNRPKEFREKVFLYLSVTLALTCLLLTFSRGAWLALFVVIVILGMAINKRILFIFLILTAVGTLFMQDLIVDRLLSVLNPTDTSSSLRIAFWESTVAMIVENPLLGVGWAGYQYAYPEYDFFINDPSVIIYHAHNMYLNMLGEIGVIGGIIYLSMFFYLIKIMYEKYTVLSKEKGYFLSIISCTFVLLLIGITDYPLFNLQISSIFWLISGSSLAALTRS